MARPIPKAIQAEESRVAQEIDLNDWTGVDVSRDPVLAREMQQAIIDYMKGRVSEGRGFNKQTLRSPYSKSYQESLDFQAAGKSAGQVNMELSGDMLGSVDVLRERQSGAVFTFGITGAEAAKAFGHISGFEGHPNQDALEKYQRIFFGVSESEFREEILPAFEQDLEALQRTEPNLVLEDRLQSQGNLQSEVIRFLRANDLFEVE